MSDIIGPWKGVYGTITFVDEDENVHYGELSVMHGFWPFMSEPDQLECTFRFTVETFLSESVAHG